MTVDPCFILHRCKLCMVDPGGFEPPTARFVAEYSIQLSYESVGAFRPDHRWLLRHGAHCCVAMKMVDPGGFEPPTARFVAEYSIQLSYESVGAFRPDHRWLKQNGLHRCKPYLWWTQEDSNLRPLGS
jgi:hypothetical protein